MRSTTAVPPRVARRVRSERLAEGRGVGAVEPREVLAEVLAEVLGEVLGDR